MRGASGIGSLAMLGIGAAVTVVDGRGAAGLGRTVGEGPGVAAATADDRGDPRGASSAMAPRKAALFPPGCEIAM